MIYGGFMNNCVKTGFRFTTFHTLKSAFCCDLRYSPAVNCFYAVGFGAGEFEVEHLRDNTSSVDAHIMSMGGVYYIRWANSAFVEHLYKYYSEIASEYTQIPIIVCDNRFY